MTILWIGLVVVAVVAVIAVLLPKDEKVTKSHASTSTRPLPRSSAPVPIEQVERKSSVADVAAAAERHRERNDDAARAVEAIAHQVAPVAPVQKAPRPRKPRATSQTVLEVLKATAVPATAKEISEQLRETTPAKVSSILVGLRRDGKVQSATRRNLKVWSAQS